MTREEAKGIIYNEVLEATAMFATWENTEEEAECLERFIEASNMAIEAFSQPERPKGRWELIHDDWNVYQCTECKEWWTLESGTPRDNNMNFCPFCGAEMDR